MGSAHNHTRSSPSTALRNDALECCAVYQYPAARRYSAVSYLLLAPELVLISVSILVLLLGLFIKEKKILGYVSIAALLVALLLVLGSFNVRESFVGYPFYSAVVVDSFAQFFNILFLTVALLVCIASLEYYGNNPSQDEYYFLVFIATTGMMLVAIANDLIVLFIGFELASLSTYALAGFDKNSKFGAEGAMKYFIFGGLSSAVLLFGISLAYGISGTVNILEMKEFLAAHAARFESIAILAMLLILAGFGFKMALVPFHMWAPDTYEGSPSVISALLAAGSKKMGFVAAFRVFLLALIAVKLQWYLAFAILAVITMTLGNVLAIMQNSVKRMLAYSSIAHAGYIAIAFAVIAYSSNAAQTALAGAAMHALSHALATASAFIAVAAVGLIYPKNDILENYDGLGKTAPTTALLMTVMLLSLAGIPPTFGFYTKFVLFLSAIQAELIGLAIIAVLNSALSVYYYARVIMRMYWGKPKTEKVKESPAYVTAMIIAVVITVILGLYPNPISEWAYGAAEAVLR
ncbi:MAG: NADH-quinone oxidoreductase subunit N [Euryarchaeota archaeon]|nr:NADH-quinone oxidoreductase subunit N [Euryarchaeota archaeon]